MGEPTLIPDCKAAIAELLATRYPTIDVIAERLGVPVRTLQRRFGEQAKSYRELVDSVRCERACQLLQEDGTRVNDVARAVGYADPSSFSRAFRRWTGISPKRFRRQKAAGTCGFPREQLIKNE